MLTPRFLIVSLLLFSSGCTSPGLHDSKVDSAPLTVSGLPVKSDFEPRSDETIKLVGEWESATFGHQTLTTRPDGTATISMSLSAVAVPIYGRIVNLDLQWILKGKYLTQHIVGGSPKRSVEKLIKRYGATHEYLLVEHDAEHLLVKDMTAGGNPIRWPAVSPIP